MIEIRHAGDGTTVEGTSRDDAAVLKRHGFKSAFEVRVGVVFEGGRKVYVYTAPATAHVGSLVVTPGNAYRPEPTVATVSTLDPPAFLGPVKSVLEVLS
jgi:hypothetical protein